MKRLALHFPFCWLPKERMQQTSGCLRHDLDSFSQDSVWQALTRLPGTEEVFFTFDTTLGLLGGLTSSFGDYEQTSSTTEYTFFGTLHTGLLDVCRHVQRPYVSGA
jgi:hypothetical protein